MAKWEDKEDDLEAFADELCWLWTVGFAGFVNLFGCELIVAYYRTDGGHRIDFYKNLNTHIDDKSLKGETKMGFVNK